MSLRHRKNRLKIGRGKGNKASGRTDARTKRSVISRGTSRYGGTASIAHRVAHRGSRRGLLLSKAISKTYHHRTEFARICLAGRAKTTFGATRQSSNRQFRAPDRSTRQVVSPPSYGDSVSLLSFPERTECAFVTHLARIVSRKKFLLRKVDAHLARIDDQCCRRSKFKEILAR